MTRLAALAVLALSGCVITFPTPGYGPQPTPAPSPLAGLWSLNIQTTQVAPTTIQFGNGGQPVYITFNYGNTSVQYTGQQLNATSSFSGGVIRVTFDNRQGTTGFFAIGQVQFVGNMNAEVTSANGTASLISTNIAGGQVATTLGPATLTRF